MPHLAVCARTNHPLPPPPPAVPPGKHGAALHHVFSLAVFEDWLYWTDWETKSVQRCRKKDGSELSVIHHESRYPMSLVVKHRLQQRQRE